MKLEKTLICVLILSIIVAFFVQACVMSYSEAEIDSVNSSLDLNNDGVINIADVMILASAFNSRLGDSRYISILDFNGDDAINMADVLIIARYFNKKLSTPMPTQIPTPTDKISQESDFDFDASRGTILKYKGPGGDVSIPSMINGVNVTGIGDSAFSSCNSLTGIAIPQGVTKIENYAFEKCTGLTNIIIPEGVADIGYGAFIYCDKLSNVVFMGNQPSLGEEVFYSSGGEDFKITVSSTATGFGKPNPYNNETSWYWQPGYYDYYRVVLSGTEIEVPDYRLDAITGTILKYKGSGGDVIIPDAINGVSVTGIGKNAFLNCSKPTSITIPESMKSIGERAFYGCSGLISITIPESVTSIGDCAFYDCSGLTSITIPESITSIGQYAFDGCIELASVIIPENVTSIEWGTFNRCSKLTGVTIPKNVTIIGADAFYGCSELTSITIPEGVTEIQSNAFGYCSGLTSIIIPESVTEIGWWAFRNCDKLSKVVFLGNQPTDFRPCVFEGIKGDFQIIVSPTATGFGKPRPYNNETYWNWAPKGNDVYRVVISGTAAPMLTPATAGQIADEADFDFCTVTGTILRYKGSGGDITIPDVIKGFSVTSIGEESFSYCSKITGITIPESVKSIRESAFSYCIGLTGITIPDSVTSIEEYAFYSCSKLTSIKIPRGLTSIGRCVFMLSGLTGLTIPESVTSIEEGAFSYCRELTSITIPESVTSLGPDAFFECTALREAIFLGDQPANFGSNVFRVRSVFSIKEDFKITVSPTAIGFGKPNPYNNETSWYWTTIDNFTYKVVISDTNF